MNLAEKSLLGDGASQLGIALSASEIECFGRLTEELLRWNSKLNLTSLKDMREIIIKHYLDSLTIYNLLPQGAIVLDIGSGAGFPSIPLKIVRNDLDILSVDSVLKKINFQKQIARLLGFEKFRPVHARLEALDDGEKGRFDFAVARAVADITVLARLAKPFLADHGKLIAMKGSRWREEIELSAKELDGLGLVVTESRELRLPFSGDERGIVLIGKK
ncbi:16S rRNA (guanine(527)-N(7))-methyltransferase RsmG [Geobacter pelophilus]|uniref:Ribosomal RNA small subunit methyltransferase G n=1 Tax=Geoanaerobacter pelophilus TaxID=60036 RepID=A0AAW4L6A1_9BACT|nr:16S rRNA (guanine(527)-N(7))-methyltransferase RsmG [Geoanaerobacter pelophilus]MBT0665060.1 16S rRNA (guanine(527)-N(7))-methyltransferase RsmG [Geoanaerobacter pelophilus]